jgi:SAM-dependent methyltransferase
MPTQNHQADFYNETYRRSNYFHYQTWLYEPYVSGLVALCGLKKGSSVLDVGCGQGFFSYLFAKNGMKVHGIDLSETGIRKAQEQYGHLGITFALSDIQTANFQERFDCIFVRSCSLYNTEDFPRKNDVTHDLLRYLKAGGTLIFAYNSNFSSKKSPTWRYHSLKGVRQHFSAYADQKVFFLNKITTYLLRRYSFTPFVKWCNVFLSKTFGMGGDVICILRKSQADETGPGQPCNTEGSLDGLVRTQVDVSDLKNVSESQQLSSVGRKGHQNLA